MLRITKLTDYAIVILADMVGPDGAEASAARDIAERTSVPQPTVSKVLKQLARARLVLSERGKHGGYRLSRDPRDISVADVVDAVEGPISVTECSTELGNSCDLEGSCPLEANWVRINDAIRSALAEITLAEMANPHAPRLVSLRRMSPVAPS